MKRKYLFLAVIIGVILLGHTNVEASSDKIRVINVPITSSGSTYQGYDVDITTGAKTSSPEAFLKSGAFSRVRTMQYDYYYYYEPAFSMTYIGNNKIRVINVPITSSGSTYQGYDVDITTGAKTPVPEAFLKSGAFSRVRTMQYDYYYYYSPAFSMAYIGNNKIRVINIPTTSSGSTYQGYDVDINTGEKTPVPEAFLKSGAFSRVRTMQYDYYYYYEPAFSMTYIGNNKIRVINVPITSSGSTYQGYDVDITTGAKTPVPEAFLKSGAFSRVRTMQYDYYYYYSPAFCMASLNAEPSISITAPAAGKKYSAVSGYNTMTLQGTVKDTDIGNTLKTYYRIDGTAGSAGTQIGVTLTANGGNQNPFTSNNTINVGSLSNGTHTLYIWTEDNHGFRSPETAVSFNLDKIRPTVSSTYPANGAVDIDKRPAITVTFSENILQSTNYGTIDLKDSSGTAAGITKSISGNKLSVTPSSDLSTSTTYTLTIPASAVKDAVGNNIAAQYSFSFTTGAADFNLDEFSGLKIGQVINFGKDGTNKLFWHYIGDGTFVMTKDSFQTLNKSMPFDDNYSGWASATLNQWLNGTGPYNGNGFLQTYMNNDSRIAYVSIPSLDEYELFSKVCKGEGTYTGSWWLNTSYSYTNVNGVTAQGYITRPNVTSSLLVRPTFRLVYEVSGGSYVDTSKDNSIFTVAQGKPFAVAVVGEEIQGDGLTIVKGVSYNVVTAVKGTGFTTLISHPEHNDGNGFSSTGVKLVTVGERKFYFIVVESPTPSTVGTVNFGL